MKKVLKGTKGYLAYAKKKALLWTIVLFMLSLGLFLTGYISTGSKENYLTIVAVLGCLPASRSLVNTIVKFRYHGISDEAFEKIDPHVQGMQTFCDLVFTSYEKNFEIHHMALQGNTLIGYSSNQKCDAKACEKHLHELFVKNGLRQIDITIFKEMPKYVKRLDSLAADSEVECEAVVSQEQAAQNAEVAALLEAISL